MKSLRGIAVVAVCGAFTVGGVAVGQDADCNVNGIPDAAEIAAGLVEDCNGNGVPDPCEYAGVHLGVESSPFGGSGKLALTLFPDALAASNARLTLQVIADLDDISEFITVQIGGTTIGTLWQLDGEACPDDPQTQAMLIPQAVVNEAILAGGLTVSLEPSPSVTDCQLAGIAWIELEYVSAVVMPDCNLDGSWDACDVSANPSLDCNSNGLIDMCEIDDDPALDCDDNGQIDSCDIAADPSLDCAGFGVLSSCLVGSGGDFLNHDCDDDGILDACQIESDPLLDSNNDGVLDACQYARGDLNLDQHVDSSDLSALLGVWGSDTSLVGDLNSDSLIDGVDLGILLLNWGGYSAPWGIVLETDPNPAVVTNDLLRQAISATGLPWRVRDLASGIELLLVPPAAFMMGCSPSYAYECDEVEYPLHEVTLTRAFYLGRYEVTQRQWTAVMGKNPSYFPDASQQVPAAQVHDRPVETISWVEIQSFELATGLRLPTESEWELAARAGTNTAFNDGTDYDGTLGAIAWMLGNSWRQTRPVGQLLPNALGFHDMHGNVSELVEDWFGWDYYLQSPATDPPGPSSGNLRVRRGGSYDSVLSDFVRVSYRQGAFPASRAARTGFRAARTP